ncbi:MAG: hypothetical protein Kow0029_31930 [Candidatus Rifleibacteriota bacterium]
MTERICYSCNKKLDLIRLHDQTLDICPECQGIFFDQGELESVIYLVKLFQTEKLEEEDIESVPEHEIKRIVQCPEDQTSMVPLDVMGLTIDQCPHCQGIWLDRGEIAALKLAENHIKQNLSLYIRLGE